MKESLFVEESVVVVVVVVDDVVVIPELLPLLSHLSYVSLSTRARTESTETVGTSLMLLLLASLPVS